MKHIFLMVMFGGTFGLAFGQYSGASARLEKDRMMIGDQVSLELTVTLPAGSKMTWPVLLDTISSHIEILKKSGIDTVSSDKKQFTVKQVLTITSFDSGSHVIKPVLFKYSHPGDSITYFTETLPLRLEVEAPQTDAAQDIRPIKPVLNAPVTFRELLPWMGLLLLVLALAAGIYFYLKKKKKAPPVVTTRLRPAIPPYEAAMEALEALRQKRLWQSGQVKEYYSELTDIVREYIELRYPVRAMEMTTGEIHAALKLTDVAAASNEKLNHILVLADLVKFAKEQPLPVDNELSMSQCMEFVRETRPAREPLNQQDQVGPSKD